MAEIDVTNKIERLEVFEERLGVSLQSLSAFLDDGGEDGIYLMVRGELQLRSGAQLKDDVGLEVTVYDTSNRIIGTGSHRFYAKKFFGFEAFGVFVTLSLNQISKVRVYPKGG